MICVTSLRLLLDYEIPQGKDSQLSHQTGICVSASKVWIEDHIKPIATNPHVEELSKHHAVKYVKRILHPSHYWSLNLALFTSTTGDEIMEAYENEWKQNVQDTSLSTNLVISFGAQLSDDDMKLFNKMYPLIDNTKSTSNGTNTIS